VTENPLTAQHLGAMVDWRALEAQFKGKTRFVTGLAEKALKQYRTSAEQLRAMAAGTGDYPDISFLAHSIKGTAGTLKAGVVFTQAAETDLAARAARPESRSMAGDLAELLEILILELEERIRNQPA